LICPQCGEDNSAGFRFCGMCGTLLETRLEARRPAGSPVPNLAKVADASEPLRRPAGESVTRPATTLVPPIGGPSMLGLGESGDGANQPSLDALREKSFSGLDSFFEPEPPRGGGRIVLMVILLAALGAAGWWTYTNYLRAAVGRKVAALSGGEAPAENPPARPTTKDAAPSAGPGSSQAAPQAKNEERPPETTDVDSGSAPKTVESTAKPEAKPAIPTPKVALGDKSAEKNKSVATSAKASKLAAPAPAAPDSGDADFHRGEAYLYGRGTRENCDEAIKNLKAASAKSNAKARSAFGTMYATGHCVPRDLPTSYLWFAMALRADPNNQILEKDLNAVWNQMTPPERQMATRMKQ
jgi:zinc-ribbon domain